MSEELKNAMSELALPDAHPDPERLAAYHAGELSAEEEGRVQDHLVLCRQCAALLLDLDGLADPGFGAEADPAAKEAVWQSLRKEIAPQSPVVPLRRPASSPRWLQALAASLLIATLGLSLWVASLRRTVAELSAPQANAPVLDLYSGTARGEGSPAPILTVPPDVRFFTLILNPAGQRRYERYRVEIVRVGGAEVWSGQEIEPSPFGSFSLTLPRRAVGPGDYRVRLFGRNGGTEEPIEEYAFRVE